MRANVNGRLGCELWVSTSIPWNGSSEGVKRFFKPTDFQVMFANERMMGVAARWDDYALDVVVAHAPCNVRHSAGIPSNENREWWKNWYERSVEPIAPRLVSFGCLMPMVKLGRTNCSAIGSYAAEKENDNGLMLREALMESDMFLPATFGKCVEEENDQWTWTSTVGTTHRLDYVAVSDNFRNNDVSAFVETSVDLATMRPDHRLVDCDIALGQEEGCEWHDRRQFGCDRNAVQSVEACARFRAMLQHASCVDWNVDVDSHLAVQNAYILHAAQQCFAKQRTPKKKDWISDHSMELVRRKRTAVRVWTELRRKWRWSALQRIFVVWRNVKIGKIPIFLLQMQQARMHAMRSIIANEREMSRLGGELKKSLANDKIQHVHTIVKAAFVERATGDDRAFWKGVRALRTRGPGGARMIALENGELAPTPYAGRQRWQRHFATLLCGEILPRSHCTFQSTADWKGSG